MTSDPIHISKPKVCQVTIQRCGFDTSNVSFKKITDTNAEQLLFHSVILMANEFVTKEQSLELVYTLALDILNELLKDKPTFNLIEELKTLKEKIAQYTIKG